jgi:hypothetical protein
MMYLMVQMDGDGTITEAYATEDSITDEEVRWPKRKKRKWKNSANNISLQRTSRP